MKIRPVGAELFAYVRTDMTELIVAFRKYANASNTVNCLLWYKMVADHLNMLMLRGLGH